MSYHLTAPGAGGILECPNDSEADGDCPQCGAAPGAVWSDDDVARAERRGAGLCTEALAEAWRWVGAGKAIAANAQRHDGRTTAYVTLDCGCVGCAAIPRESRPRYAWRDSSQCVGGHTSAGVRPS
jgi:hypothetical protein